MKKLLHDVHRWFLPASTETECYENKTTESLNTKSQFVFPSPADK